MTAVGKEQRLEKERRGEKREGEEKKRKRRKKKKDEPRLLCAASLLSPLPLFLCTIFSQVVDGLG